MYCSCQDTLQWSVYPSLAGLIAYLVSSDVESVKDNTDMELLLMPTGCGLSVVPQTDQFLAVSSPLNVTFTCNASMDELNSAGAIVSWQVGGIRVDTTAAPFVGVFVEDVAPGVLDITVTGAAGVQFEESGLSLACQLTTASIPPSMTSLAPVFVQFFGELPVRDSTIP